MGGDGSPLFYGQRYRPALPVLSRPGPLRGSVEKSSSLRCGIFPGSPDNPGRAILFARKREFPYIIINHLK